MIRLLVILSLCALTILRTFFKWKAGFYTARKGLRLMFSRDEGVGLIIARSLSGLGLFAVYTDFIFLIPVQKSVLSLTYLPLGNLVPYGGMVFIIGGLALLWTAHRQLGKEFSTTLTVPSERKLITKGIYACIRHPIYSAYCLFFFGIAMLSSSWLAALTAGTLMYILMGPRLKKEEALLESVFGQEFLLWAGRTGRFLPRWNHRGRRAG
jgi:protein-S-isoprenylcysteine O-methyltransferase Ste14